jgi:hypothetical protein
MMHIYTRGQLSPKSCSYRLLLCQISRSSEHDNGRVLLQLEGTLTRQPVSKTDSEVADES